MDQFPVKARSGWLEVITGSMFSGKSEELIRRLRRAQIARQKVQIFKPAIDNRYSREEIVSHSEMKIASVNVSTSRELSEQVIGDGEIRWPAIVSRTDERDSKIVAEPDRGHRRAYHTGRG